MGADARAEKSAAHFTISVPPSAASSRSSSPAPSIYFNDDYNDRERRRDEFYALRDNDYDPKAPLRVHDIVPLPDHLLNDVYDKVLPAWRASIRRRLVGMVQWESRVIAKMQAAIRTPWLDTYFVYTSLLGTHTFFMILLPAFSFFGRGDICRGLLMVLAVGVYLSSVAKDLFCSPRPFAPPVVRLTIGSHHLEYGFPSTHSTNSVSIALFFYSNVYSYAFPSTSLPILSPDGTHTNITDSAVLGAEVMSSQAFSLFTLALAFYTFSIVFGRLYTAMHSFTDCITGILLGTGIWWAHSSWSGHALVLSLANPLSTALSMLGFGTKLNAQEMIVYVGKGLGVGEWIDNWVERGGWEVPLILIPICLLAVNQHPQPVDDCPCFEDAIAFGSVVLGSLVGRWVMKEAGIGAGMKGHVVMPGSGWVIDVSGRWMQVERDWSDVGVWWSVAVIKMTVGILTIFVWRILAKSALHLILPPTFRFLARMFRLPNRRFYTPATEYKNVPSEFHVGDDGSIGLHAIPSVIDLPSSAGVRVEVGGIGSGVDGVSNWNSSSQDREMKMRLVNGSGTNGTVFEDKKTSGANGHGGSVHFKLRPDEEEDAKDKEVKHYDADVLTKVIVYAGIAFLACEVLPLMFELAGWGLKSWI